MTPPQTLETAFADQVDRRIALPVLIGKSLAEAAQAKAAVEMALGTDKEMLAMFNNRMGVLLDTIRAYSKLSSGT